MYLFSNSIGTFVFNEHFNLREKVLFTEQQTLSNCKLIEEGKELETEKKFLNKFKTIENLRETKDIKKLSRILEQFRAYTNEFYNLNLVITRRKIRGSVSDDLLITQTISSLDELVKTINLLVKRAREWYSHYFPELDNSVQDNEAFVRLVLTKSKIQLLKDNKIRYSMGADLKDKDVDAILQFVRQISQLSQHKNKQEKYLESLMNKTCPNLTAITGPLIGAKLIMIAGSLRKMVLFPSSTIQLLGAEKALFRHMINKKSLPPKYGILHEHPYIQKAKKKHHGKIARLLADKISLAVKLDYFKGEFRGDLLKKQIEHKIHEISK